MQEDYQSALYFKLHIAQNWNEFFFKCLCRSLSKTLSDSKSYKKGCLPFCPTINDEHTSIQCCDSDGCNTGTGLFKNESTKVCYQKGQADQTESTADCVEGSSVCYVTKLEGTDWTN